MTTTTDNQFDQLVDAALARILEASSSTYLPDALGRAHAEAIIKAAGDPSLAPETVALISDGRTVADLAQLSQRDLEELCSEAAGEDPQYGLASLLDADEIGHIGSPIGGGMNSGTSSTLFAFVCNGRRYTYEYDFDGMADEYWCKDGCSVDTDEGRAAFVDRVIEWFEPLWGHSECWVADGIIPAERMDDLRGSPWEHDVIANHVRGREVDESHVADLADELAADTGIDVDLARTFITEMWSTGVIETDHPLADRAGWWLIETQLQ